MVNLVKQWFPNGVAVWQQVIVPKLAFLNWLTPAPDSADYQAWRDRFMVDRLRVTLWVALPCFLTLASFHIYFVLFQTEQLRSDLARVYGDGAIAEPLRDATVMSCLWTFVLLLVWLIIFHRTAWGVRHPIWTFLGFSWSLTLTTPIISSLYGLPEFPDTFVFLAQAVLIPVHWRLHLVAQLLPIAYFAIGYPLLGITTLGDRSIYDIYSIGVFANLFWVCLICDLAVYLYERLKRSEFESQRQLRIFLHSVTHDLRTPVMGTKMLLTHLLANPDQQVPVNRMVLERLQEGSDRQMTLINSLLEAHQIEVHPFSLHRESIHLSDVVESVLADLDALLEKHQIHIENQIGKDLPPIYADANQLWRVLCNLISNTMKHNPQGIQVTLSAKVVEGRVTEATAPRSHTLRSRLRAHPRKQSVTHPDDPNCLLMRCGRRSPLPFATVPMLHVSIQDTGLGISPQQCDRLFELYARGARARYTPGLGLGLYLCRQIITAHNGEIGVISRPNEGATFWFTIPLYRKPLPVSASKA